MSEATVTSLVEYRERRMQVPIVDPSLEHQLRLVCSRGGGAGITAACNCGARLSRNLAVGENAIAAYRGHMRGDW